MRPILILGEPTSLQTANEIAAGIASRMSFDTKTIPLSSLDDIGTLAEEEDAALLVFGLDTNKNIRRYLKQLHEIRIPYIFVREGATFDLQNIALPVTFLMEEKEKGPYTASFARYYNASVTIVKPNDYGSKAEQNIAAITTLLQSFGLNTTIVNGKKDSFKIEQESLTLSGSHQMVVIGASRDYGLDDILFGTKEEKIIRKAEIPVLVVNPRGDLYALCD